MEKFLFHTYQVDNENSVLVLYISCDLILLCQYIFNLIFKICFFFSSVNVGFYNAILPIDWELQIKKQITAESYKEFKN